MHGVCYLMIMCVDRSNQQVQIANRSSWQTMLLEAGGIGAAVSEESMKRLQYCLEWLQVGKFNSKLLSCI